MSLTWFVLGLAAGSIAFLALLILLRMTAEQDRDARHGEKRLNPHSEVTITRFGDEGGGGRAW